MIDRDRDTERKQENSETSVNKAKERDRVIEIDNLKDRDRDAETKQENSETSVNESTAEPETEGHREFDLLEDDSR